MEQETAKNHERKGKNDIKRAYKEPIIEALSTEKKLEMAHFCLNEGDINTANHILNSIINDSEINFQELPETHKKYHERIRKRLNDYKTGMWDTCTNDEIKVMFYKIIGGAEESVFPKEEHLDLLETFLKFLKDNQLNSDAEYIKKKIEYLKTFG